MVIAMIGQKGLPARSGGIERHVSLLASGLALRGHRVIVFGRTWYVAGARAPFGVEQVCTPGIHTKHLDALSHTLTALVAARAYHPDIIHVHGSGVEILIPLVRLLHPRAKIIFTFHSINSAVSKWNRLAKLGLRLSAWVGCHTAHRAIAVSEALTRHCLDAFGCQATYISHPFYPQEQVVDPKVPESLGLTPGRYLLFVGRLIPDKRAHVLIQSYARLAIDRPELVKDIPLVIVGSGAWTDAYVRWLSALAAKTPGVQLLGEKLSKELASLQAFALAHVFPTACEGLSIAVLEAASFARPIVATDLVQNYEATGGHAIRVRSDDVKSLEDGLIRLLEMSPAERDALGQKAASYVAARYRASDRLDDIDRLYRETLHGYGNLVTQSVR